MNWITSIMEWTNERAHRFTAFDLKLVQFMGISIALIIVKLVPEIMKVNIWWFIGSFVIFSMRPIYIFLRRI